MQPGEWGELAGDSVADRGDAAAVEDGAVEGSAADGVDAAAVECGEGDEATTEPDRRDDSDSPGVAAFYRGP